MFDISGINGICYKSWHELQTPTVLLIIYVRGIHTSLTQFLQLRLGLIYGA
jgi:hypothetical protein